MGDANGLFDELDDMDLAGGGGGGFGNYAAAAPLYGQAQPSPQQEIVQPQNTWNRASAFVPFGDYVALAEDGQQKLNPSEAVVFNVLFSNLAEGATCMSEWISQVRNNANQACPEATAQLAYIRRLLETIVSAGQNCVAVAPEGTATMEADADADDGAGDGMGLGGAAGAAGAFPAAAGARNVARRGAEDAEERGPTDWCPSIVDPDTSCSSPSIGYMLEMLMKEPAANAKPSEVLGFRVWLFNFNVNVSLDEAFVRAIRNAAAAEQERKKKPKAAAVTHMERGPLQGLKELYWAYTHYVRVSTKCAFLFRSDNRPYCGTAPGEPDVYPGQLHNMLLWVKGKEHPLAITRRLNPLTEHALSFGLDDADGLPLKVWDKQLQRETYFADPRRLEWAPLEREPGLEPFLWGFNDLYNGKLLSPQARLPPLPAASGNVPASVRECFREFAMRELGLAYMRTVDGDHPVVLQACMAYCRNQALPSSVADYKMATDLACVHHGPGPYDPQTSRVDAPTTDLSVKPRQQAYATMSRLVSMLYQQCAHASQQARGSEAELCTKAQRTLDLFNACIKEQPTPETQNALLGRKLRSLTLRLEQLTLSEGSGFDDATNTVIKRFNHCTKSLLVAAQNYLARVTDPNGGGGPAVKAAFRAALELHRDWLKHPRARFARARKDLMQWSIAYLGTVMRAREAELPKAMVKRTAAAWAYMQEHQRLLLRAPGDARLPSETVFRAERPLSLFGDMMQFLTDFSREVLQIWEKPTMFLMFFTRQFEPLIPDAKWRWRIYGPPGCGKSHFIEHMKALSLAGTVATNVNGSEQSDVQGQPEESGGMAFTDEEQTFASKGQANVVKSIISARVAGRKRAYKEIGPDGNETWKTRTDVAEHEEVLGELCNSDPLSNLTFSSAEAGKETQGEEHKGSWRDRHFYSYWRGFSPEQQAKTSPQGLQERMATPQYAEMVSRYNLLCSLITVAMPYCSIPGLDVDLRPFYELSNELQGAARGFFEVPSMRTRQLHAQKMLYRVLTVGWAMWTRAMFSPPDPATWPIAPLRSWSDVTVENLLMPVAELLRVSCVEVGAFSFWLERYYSAMGPLYDQVLFSLVEVMGISENATLFGLPAEKKRAEAAPSGAAAAPKAPLGTAARQWKRMHVLARRVLAAALEHQEFERPNSCPVFKGLGDGPPARAKAFCDKATSKAKGFTAEAKAALSAALATTLLFKEYAHANGDQGRVVRSKNSFVAEALKLLEHAPGPALGPDARAHLEAWRELYGDSHTAEGALTQLLGGSSFPLPAAQLKDEWPRGPSGPLAKQQVWPYENGFKQLGSVIDEKSIREMSTVWERFMGARAARRANPRAKLTQEQADLLTPPPAVLASIYDQKTVGESLQRAHKFDRQATNDDGDTPRSRFEDSSQPVHFHAYTEGGVQKFDFSRMLNHGVGSWAELADAALKTATLRKLRVPAEFVRGAFMLFQQTVKVARLQREQRDTVPSVTTPEGDPDATYQAFANEAALETLERLDASGGCTHTFMATHMAMQRNMFPVLTVDTESDRHLSDAQPFEICKLRKPKKGAGEANGEGEGAEQYAFSVNTDFLIYLIEFRNFMRMSMRSEHGVERHVEPEFAGATTTFDSFSHEGSTLPLGWDLPFLCKIKYVMGKVVWRRKAFKANVLLPGDARTREFMLQPCWMVTPVCTLAPGRSELYLFDASVPHDADAQECVPPVVRARLESKQTAQSGALEALSEALESPEASQMAETTFRVLTGRNPAPGELEKMNESTSLMSAITRHSLKMLCGAPTSAAAGSSDEAPSPKPVANGWHAADPFQLTVLKVLDSCLALAPPEMVAGSDAQIDGADVQVLQSQTQLLEEVVSTCNVRLQNAQIAAPPPSEADTTRAAEEVRLAKKAREAHVEAALVIGTNRAPDRDLGVQCSNTLSNLTKQRVRSTTADDDLVDDDLDDMEVDDAGPGGLAPNGRAGPPQLLAEDADDSDDLDEEGY